MSETGTQTGSVWKWVALGVGGCLLLGILGVGGCVVLVSQFFKVQLDPEAAEKIASEVIQYEFPGESNVVAIEVFDTQWVGVTSPDQDLQLVLGKLPSSLLGGTSPETFQKEFTSEFDSQGIENMEVTSHSTEPFSVCDQEIELTVLEGRLDDKDSISYQAAIEDKGALIFAMISATGSDKTEIESKARSVLNSLSCN